MNEIIQRGARLKAARKAKHWTLKDLAQAASISFSYVSMLERGARGAQVKIEELKKLAVILDVEPDYLIYGASAQDAEVPTLDKAQISEWLKKRPQPFFFRLENEAIEENDDNQHGKLVLIDPNLKPQVGDKVLLKSQHSECNYFMRKLTQVAADGSFYAESTRGNWLPVSVSDHYEKFEIAGVLFDLGRK